MRILVGVITAFSWASLFLERFAHAFLMPLTLALFYAACVLIGLQPGSAVFLIFIAAMIILCLRSVAVFSLPTWAEALRAAEITGGVAHRAFSQRKDTPAGTPDAQQKRLWQQAQARLAQQGLHLSVPVPRLRLADQDPYGLRHAALLLAVVGFVIAGPMAQERLRQGFSPALPPVKTETVVKDTLDIALTPPDYTSEPVQKIFPRAAGAAKTWAVTAPENSVVKIAASGYKPYIRLGGARVSLTALDHSLIAEEKLHATETLTIGFWPWNKYTVTIHVTPDKPPAVKLLMAGRGTRDNLKVVYSAEDDYGLTSLKVTVTANDDKNITYETDIPASAFGADTTSAHLDLTQHPLTGRVATVVLTGTDAAGHVTRTEPMTVLVPEKKFRNAAAQRLAFESKRLQNFFDLLTRLMSGKVVADIAEQPVLYGGRPIIFLGLASAFHRLEQMRNDKAARETAPLLWDLALAVEDSGLGTAARELSEALKSFARAMQDPNITENRLQELLTQVREKMQAYTRALAADMQQKGLSGKSASLSPELAQRLFKRIDMESLMKRLADMRRGDNREQMRKMAEMLQQSVENYDPEEAERQRQQAAALFAALDKLKALIDKQQALHDTTRMLDDKDDFKTAEKSQDGLKDEAQSLTTELEEATKSPASPDMAEAAAAMTEATDALKKQQSKDAGDDQQKALNALQKVLDNMLDEIAKQMEQQLAQGFMPDGMNPSDGQGGERDPLGRPIAPKNSDVRIPTEMERRTVQDILQELQKRSGDYTRPDQERDYLRRLLNLF